MIEFIEAKKLVDLKKVYVVTIKNRTYGEIKWFREWRTFVFYPKCYIALRPNVLRVVADFIENLMIEFSNGGRLIEEPDELPVLPSNIENLYLDFETSSNSPKHDSLNPWDKEHCTVIGAGVTWDDHPYAYFIPRALLMQDYWLDSLFERSETWVNQNVKYDSHVAFNDLGYAFDGNYIDTISLTKIYDIDLYYKGGYSIENLSATLLNKPIIHYKQRLQKYLDKTKDFATIPIDVLAEYGCQDAVLTVRELHNWLLEHLPEDSAWVQGNEAKLTKTLIDVERRGFPIDPLQVKIQCALDMKCMIDCGEYLKEKVGKDFNPLSPIDCYDFLINVAGFPRMYNEKAKDKAKDRRKLAEDDDKIHDKDEDDDGVTFDKNTLTLYRDMGLEYAKFSDIVQAMLDYRESSQRVSLFWNTWLELCDEDGILHPDYNQNVRSGRLSCRKPNSQQLNYAAKNEVRRKTGRILKCWDYSQLEYRWMIHYLNNKAGIKAYNENPKQDYHQWVATELCGGIPRKAAKTMNFRIGFGGGKKGVVFALSLEPYIREITGGNPGLIKIKGGEVYEEYHRNLPELKKCQRQAENAARQGGYVKTLYGRRLQLPKEAARKGFNRVVQSTAADNAKEAMNDASPTHNKLLRQLDVYLIAQVHDSYLYDMPDDEEVIALASAEIERCLQAPSKRCKVPIIAICNNETGADNWATAEKGG